MSEKCSLINLILQKKVAQNKFTPVILLSSKIKLKFSQMKRILDSEM